ncbi:MAG: hypothetical protein WA865_07345 [Spirulinaceae cyanobacterium]
MTKLTIELPEKLEKQLLAVAKRENLSLETFILKLLTKLVSFYTKKEQDNLLNIQIIKTDSIRKNSFDQAKNLDFATSTYPWLHSFGRNRQPNYLFAHPKLTDTSKKFSKVYK